MKFEKCFVAKNNPEFYTSKVLVLLTLISTDISINPEKKFVIINDYLYYNFETLREFSDLFSKLYEVNFDISKYLSNMFKEFSEFDKDNIVCNLKIAFNHISFAEKYRLES